MNTYIQEIMNEVVNDYERFIPTLVVFTLAIVSIIITIFN